VRVRSGPATVTRDFMSDKNPGSQDDCRALVGDAFPRTPAQPGYAAGADTRREGTRCGRFRSPPSSVLKTWHSP
jgi:hypothetical protein